MFIETAVALFALGSLTGMTLVYLLGCQPYAQENEALRLRLAERRLADDQDAHDYRKHKGTPYIAPLPTDVERVLTDISDNDRWSRKAPGLRSVS